MLEIPFLPDLDHLTEPDQITSLLDDKGARGEIDIVNWPEQFPYRPMASFSIAYTHKAIYIDFLTRCNYLLAENTADNSPVSNDSCVEFFLQPPGDGAYYNFEFNCIGTIYGSRRYGRPNPDRMTSDILAKVKRFPSITPKPFKELEGLFTWSLLVVIPFDLMGLDGTNLPEGFRANFYKCAAGASEPHYLTWAPIKSEKPDFHRPEFFQEIRFAK